MLCGIKLQHYQRMRQALGPVSVSHRIVTHGKILCSQHHDILDTVAPATSRSSAEFCDWWYRSPVSLLDVDTEVVLSVSLGALVS